MQRIIYQILTDFVVILHLCFILFVIAGGFLTRGRRWLTFTHLGAAIWAIYAELSPGIVCPLTALENYFGYLAGQLNYQEDFITRYLIPVIYQESVSPTLQYALVAIVILINIIAYKANWKRKTNSID